MSEKATVVARTIEQTNGVSKKTNKAYVQHKLTDANGVIYSCFDGSIVAPITGQIGEKVDIEYEINGNFKNLISAAPHSNGASLPEPYTAKTESGEPDWDKKSLHITRCGLWNAFLKGHLAANLYAKAVAELKETTGDPMDRVIITGTRLVVHAEKDVFERPAGDDGVPF